MPTRAKPSSWYSTMRRIANCRPGRWRFDHWRGLLCALCMGMWGVCHAGSLRFCDQHAELSAAQQDKLLRFGAVIKAELEKSGRSLALISRSGLDLSRFGVRYSHAGL